MLEDSIVSRCAYILFAIIFLYRQYHTYKSNYLHMAYVLNWGVPKQEYPQIIHYKPTISGYLYFRKPLQTVLLGCFNSLSFWRMSPFLAEESCQTAAEPTEKMPKKMVTPGRFPWGYHGWDEAIGTTLW